MRDSRFVPEVERSASGRLPAWTQQATPGPESGRSASAFPRPPQDGEDPLIHVAQRLQRRLERQVELLGRLQADEQRPEQAAGLSELLDTARRMRRDSEGLLLLRGADPGFGRGGPRTVSDVLSDAVAAAQEPWRVELRPAPSATLGPRAAGELLHLLAELLDHATSVAVPEARVDVVSRLDGDGGMTVEVITDVADGWPAERGPGRSGPTVAERLAQRSGTAIRLQRPLGGFDPETGLVAGLHCPSALISLTEPAPAPPHGGYRDLSGPVRRAEAHRDAAPRTPAEHWPSTGLRTPMDRLMPQLSAVGDLFGPMRDRRDEPADDPVGTPIFEAIASAWFREGDARDEERSGESESPAEPDSGSDEPLDWESPSDAEWRAATARAARPDTGATTSSGLPRRRPGTQLVPPPRAQGVAGAAPGDRVPDRVRDRLATYQRGLRQGRHRAADPTPSEPVQTDSDDVQAWWSKPGT